MVDKATDTRPAIFFINEAVIDKYELSPYEGWLYVVILRHANHTTGEAFPGIARLCKLAKMSKSQVIRAISTLEAKELIRVERDTKPLDGEKRQRGVNHYFILAVGGSVSQTLGVEPDSNYPSATQKLGVVPTSNNKYSSSNSSKKKTEREILLEQLTPYIEIAQCILVLIEVGYDDKMHKPNEYMSNVLIKKYVPVLEELKRLEATPNELKGLHAHFKPVYEQNGWTFGVSSFVTKLQPYRALKKSTPARKPAPITDFKEPTAAERAALEAARKSVRPEWENEETEAVS